LGAYLIRRSLVAEVGGFEPSQSVLADCHFVFQCAVHAKKFAHNPTNVCLYRIHLKGQSMATRSQRLFYEENLRNAEFARRHWMARAIFDGSRKDAYLRVLDYLARVTARRHPDLFAAVCGRFEEIVGRSMPFGLAPTKLAVGCLGYGRYRWFQSLLRS
jgi:hypothetical protein